MNHSFLNALNKGSTDKISDWEYCGTDLLRSLADPKDVKFGKK